jgi:outer membrane protein assembly factor BamB
MIFANTGGRSKSEPYMIKRFFFVVFLIFNLAVGTSTQSIMPVTPVVSASESILALPLILAWKYDSDETTSVTPATDGKQVYVPTSSGGIVALNAATGKLVWRESMGGQISAEPVADQAAVFVANGIVGSSPAVLQANGAVRALSLESGVTLWMRTLPFSLQGGLITDKTAVYGASTDGRVYALRKHDGMLLWVKQFSSSFISHPAAGSGRLYLGSEDGFVYALDVSTGDVVWRYRTRGAIRGRPAISEGLIAVGSADGYVYALEETSGFLRWRVRTGAAVQSVAIPGAEVIAASLDNFAYGFSATKGARLWKRELGGRPLAEPLSQGYMILLNPISGNIAIVLDARDGKVLNRLPTGDDNNSSAAPVVAGKILMLTTRTGLLAFSRPE